MNYKAVADEFMRTIETLTGGGVLTRGLGRTAVTAEFTDKAIARLLRR